FGVRCKNVRGSGGALRVRRSIEREMTPAVREPTGQSGRRLIAFCTLLTAPFRPGTRETGDIEEPRSEARSQVARSLNALCLRRRRIAINPGIATFTGLEDLPRDRVSFLD